MRKNEVKLASIGVFDSGVGGLTVYKELVTVLPTERYIYLGDTARTPYGSKSMEKVAEYLLSAYEFFLRQDVKILVVACNTASTCMYKFRLFDKFRVPVVDMIYPVAKYIADSDHKRIGVIGTRTTIMSRTYESAIKSMCNREVEVIARACPLFVPLVEEGLYEGDLAKLAVEEYLSDLADEKITALILGCTHYPYLITAISEVLGEEVEIIECGRLAALEAKRVLKLNELSSPVVDTSRQDIFCVTDEPDRFKEIYTHFFCSQDQMHVEIIDLGEFTNKDYINVVVKGHQSE